MNAVPKPRRATCSRPRCAQTLAQEYVADIVETLNDQDTATVAAVLLALPFERAVQVLDQPELIEAAEALALIPRIAPRSSSRRCRPTASPIVVRDFEQPLRQRLLGRVDHETRSALTRLLAYPEHSAGSIMTTEFVSVPSTWTVGQTLDHIRRVERSRETVYAIYVLDPATRALARAVPLRRLISGDPQAPVASVVPARRPIRVSPETDREDVARLISKYDLLAVPVVDAAEHVIGIVTVDDVIDAMIDETTEDVQKLGGMEALDEPYNEIGFAGMIRKRAGWLSVLLLGEMLTASAMQYFEDELEKAIVLTLFIPLIMSSGGNSGSQATSLIIRALALREVSLKDWWRVALRELPTGLTLGTILGVHRHRPHRALAAGRLLRLRRALACWSPRRSAPPLVGIVTFGSLVGLDAALHPEAPRLRSRQRLGALRRDAGRRHRPGDLFRRRRADPERPCPRPPTRQAARTAHIRDRRFTAVARLRAQPASTRCGGKVISTSVPSFLTLVIVIAARLASTSALVSGRPRPVPPERRVVGTCRNGSSASAISLSSMPMPVSRTRRIASPWSPSAVETMTCPPASVNFTAFDRRLMHDLADRALVRHHRRQLRREARAQHDAPALRFRLQQR